MSRMASRFTVSAPSSLELFPKMGQTGGGAGLVAVGVVGKSG